MTGRAISGFWECKAPRPRREKQIPGKCPIQYNTAMSPDGLTMLDMAHILSRIDLALLHPDATRSDLEHACTLARESKFHSVSTHSSRIVEAAHLLEESGVQTGCVIGFPSGAMEPDVKRYEVEAAIDSGAQEIEVMLNAGRFKDRAQAGLLRELRDIVEAADERPVGAIIDCNLLNHQEKVLACDLVAEAGAQFIVAMGGTGSDLISVVRLLRGSLEPKFGVKALAALHDVETATGLLQAGATRLGALSTSGLPALLKQDFRP
jgi:deoxyribose-phosphate aldolase